ncbi:MAG: hypothetical protein EOO28_09940 [Comamonadaceae bacterium]|nr:MAG: hypothetical protein EOO28_09940 [Comamonadaceae bacterium]
MRMSWLATLLAVAGLAACSSAPKPADWQLEAKGATDRAIAAYLEGNSRVEAVESARARAELSSTGRIDLVARGELLRCASRVASLVLEPCAAFEALRQDAPAAESAYADYLAGRLKPADVGLLPEAQRVAAAASAESAGAAVQAIRDPLSRLVAAGVALQTGRASPSLVAEAVNTASAQGWRRPLLAWLGVQASLAEKSGNLEEAARVRRRIELTQNAPVRASLMAPATAPLNTPKQAVR